MEVNHLTEYNTEVCFRGGGGTKELIHVGVGVGINTHVGGVN